MVDGSGPGRFPFGAPVRGCGTETPPPVGTVILGAYPSALHVHWQGPHTQIRALAVDNEPTVFWDGTDAEPMVQAWAATYFDPAWGTVTAHGNGPSGAWVNDLVLGPLQAVGETSWFLTDCLPTYRASPGGRTAIIERYQPFAEAHAPRLEPAVLARHPSESQIVAETLGQHQHRIQGQIQAAQPTRIVTLGDAAARVVAALTDWTGSGRVSTRPYGHPRPITLAGQPMAWFALAHPAARGAWQDTHKAWLAADGFATTPPPPQ